MTDRCDSSQPSQAQEFLETAIGWDETCDWLDRSCSYFDPINYKSWHGTLFVTQVLEDNGIPDLSPIHSLLEQFDYPEVPLEKCRFRWNMPGLLQNIPSIYGKNPDLDVERLIEQAQLAYRIGQVISHQGLGEGLITPEIQASSFDLFAQSVLFECISMAKNAVQISDINDGPDD